MWSAPPNKDIINTKKDVKIAKNIHESGTSCKCVYADKYSSSGVNQKLWFPAAYFQVFS